MLPSGNDSQFATLKMAIEFLDLPLENGDFAVRYISLPEASWFIWGGIYIYNIYILYWYIGEDGFSYNHGIFCRSLRWAGDGCGFLLNQEPADGIAWTAVVQGNGRLGKQDLDYPLRGKISVHVYTVCVSLSLYLSIYLSFFLIYRSIYLSYPSIHPAISLSVYLSTSTYGSTSKYIYIYAYIFLSPTVTIEFAAHICIYICMCVTLCFMVYGQIWHKIFSIHTFMCVISCISLYIVCIMQMQAWDAKHEEIQYWTKPRFSLGSVCCDGEKRLTSRPMLLWLRPASTQFQRKWPDVATFATCLSSVRLGKGWVWT